MKRDMDYIKYCSFLNSLERNFANLSVGKTEEQKKAMLQLAQEMIEDFRKIYGDQPRVNQDLQQEAQTAAFELPLNLN